MTIALAGSLGHIGKPLTQTLADAGHAVTVISSALERRAAIAALGAAPAIGTLEDVDFLAATFAGADAAYVMVPPADYFDQDLDLVGYFRDLGEGFAEAIRRAGVKRVVNLSSIGAHLPEGNGILEGTYHVEQALDALPADVAVAHVRPTEIYYNLYQFIDLIREHGIIANNLAPTDHNVWVSPRDIAAAVAEELTAPAGEPRTVRYVASDEVTYAEVASALGAAIGKPDLQWVQLPDAQLRDTLAGAGMQPAIAGKMVEMYAAIRSGLLYEDYAQHKPATLGAVKVGDFAREFAAVYAQH